MSQERAIIRLAEVTDLSKAVNRGGAGSMTTSPPAPGISSLARISDPEAGRRVSWAASGAYAHGLRKRRPSGGRPRAAVPLRHAPPSRRVGDTRGIRSQPLHAQSSRHPPVLCLRSLRRWPAPLHRQRVRHPGVVAWRREGGDELLTFFTFPKAQWKPSGPPIRLNDFTRNKDILDEVPRRVGLRGAESRSREVCPSRVRTLGAEFRGWR
jgi:hypothetical protein